ncbi:MAG: hypothetical protein IH598_09425 [Bacteroidales bacterium]|nr:hypothetical protein [Bacteroidales bacterium]
MKKLIHILFLSCIKATELIEKNFHFKLSRKEKMQLRIHTIMCDACKCYENQSAFLEKAIAASLHKELIDSELKEAKEKIIHQFSGSSK